MFTQSKHISGSSNGYGRWWFTLATIILLGMSVNAAEVAAQLPAGQEYPAKFRMISKIAHYVHSGAGVGLSQNKSLAIGFLGTDPFGSFLEKHARNQRIHGLPIEVKRFLQPADFKSCDLLFVSATTSAQDVQQIVNMTAGKKILLVGEFPGFENAGGVFNLHRDESGKFAIKLNIDAAKRRQFRIDARLLQVCEVVRDRNAAANGTSE